MEIQVTYKKLGFAKIVGKNSYFNYECSRCGNHFEAYKMKSPTGTSNNCKCVQEEKSFYRSISTLRPVGATLLGSVGYKPQRLGKYKATKTVKKSHMRLFMMFRCHKCGNHFEAYKAQATNNGLSHTCKCNTRPSHFFKRDNNLKPITDFEKSLVQDEHEGKECCANCIKFDTVDCRYEESTIHEIEDMFSHKCEDFKEV